MGSQTAATICDHYCSRPGKLVLEDVIVVDGEPFVWRYHLCEFHRAWWLRKNKSKQVIIQETPDELLLARWCKKPESEAGRE